MSEVNNTDGKLKSRAGLLGLLGIFFGPLVLATWMFYNLDAWQHPERSNYGELMLPIQPLDVFNVQDDSAETFGLDLFKQTWTLIYVGSSGCDIYCETSLFGMRQSRSMLGNDMSRLQYVFLAIDDQSFAAAKQLQTRHPKLMVMRVMDNSQTLAQFGTQPLGQVFLVDPHANRVLRYKQGFSTKGLYGDLHKLLENSRIG